jgi:hypothetical protein
MGRLTISACLGAGHFLFRSLFEEKAAAEAITVYCGCLIDDTVMCRRFGRAMHVHQESQILGRKGDRSSPSPPTVVCLAPHFQRDLRATRASPAGRRVLQ